MTNLDSGPSWSVGEKLTNVKSRKMADLVASRLREMIARGDLKEGDWLPTEPELTERFGVSRPTLREAFRLLEGDGLVVIRRGPPGGARVQLPGPEHAARLFGLILTLSGTTLKDVYQARMVIEPPAVRDLAAKASESDVAALRDAISTAREATSDDAFAEATTQFHQALVERSGNHTLAAVIGMLSEITTRHISMGYRETRRRDTAALNESNDRLLKAYEKLLTLIAENKAEEAETYWRGHMKKAFEVLMADSGGATDVIDVLE